MFDPSNEENLAFLRDVRAAGDIKALVLPVFASGEKASTLLYGILCGNAFEAVLYGRPLDEKIDLCGRVIQATSFAKVNGVNGFPTVVFSNGKRYNGALPPDRLRALLSLPMGRGF